MFDREYISLDKWFYIAPSLLESRAKAYDTQAVVCPAPEDCFRALEDMHPDHVRVVILGQDPYHSVYEKMRGVLSYKANGRAFAYHKFWDGRVDSSMGNIMIEIGALPLDRDRTVDDFDTSLEHWAAQGVLLLNTCLTVEAGKPMSHRNIGWQQGISDILKYLHHTSDTLFICWGREARELCGEIPEERKVVTSHPCKLSAHRGFLGSRWHELVNEKLIAQGKESIKWI